MGWDGNGGGAGFRSERYLALVCVELSGGTRDQVSFSSGVDKCVGNGEHVTGSVAWRRRGNLFWKSRGYTTSKVPVLFLVQ